MELAVAALFTAHNLALQELRRQSPHAGYIYEAIYVYASVPASPARQEALAKLVTPAFSALRIVPSRDVGGVHFRAQPEFLLSGMHSAKAAVSSDDAFSSFLAVVSSNEYVSETRPMTLPCTALAKRPGLVAALGSHYGGAMDGRMPRADCDATLPPTPSFDRLVHEAVEAQPFCQGTIRFSLGADFQMQIVKLRLHQLASDQQPPLTSDASNFRQSHASLLGAAKNEVKTYYARFFALLPAVASRDASLAVDEAVQSAFGLCEDG